jgi:hypothetical protein
MKKKGEETLSRVLCHLFAPKWITSGDSHTWQPPSNHLSSPDCDGEGGGGERMLSTLHLRATLEAYRRDAICHS